MIWKHATSFFRVRELCANNNAREMELKMTKLDKQDNSYKEEVVTKLAPNARVYVLSGASHQGKSTTLNKLADELNSASGWRLTKGPNTPFQGRRDTQYIFDDTRKSIKVGISTAGDDEDQITKGFKFFRANKCDVCFIASKTSGASIIAIETECNNDGIIPQYHFLIGNYGPRTRNKVQDDVVKQLINLI